MYLGRYCLQNKNHNIKLEKCLFQNKNECINTEKVTI